MNRNFSACIIKIDENNYLKHKTVCKSCYNKTEEKTSQSKKFFILHPNNQKSIMLTIKIMFHNLKIMPMLLLVRETWEKPIKCSKYLKKK